jgi:hypothetical protein
MNNKLRDALNQLLGLIDNRILVFSDELDPSEVCNAQYQIDKADEVLAEQKYEAKWKLGVEYEYACCSHCGHLQWASWDSSREAMENIGEFHKKYKFCPNCGFEMKGDS